MTQLSPSAATKAADSRNASSALLPVPLGRLVASLTTLAVSVAVACGGSGSSFNNNGNNGLVGSGSGAPNLGGGSGSGGGGGSGGGTGDGGYACPPGLQCDVSCSGGGTTTVTGKVYDPAGKNPLYNVAVYVPAVALSPLPKGVPTGSDACSCGALFQSGAIVNTTTDVDGSFTLNNVPVGTSVPLVLQVGKWRRSLKIAVNSCSTNAQPDKSLTLPGTVAAGDTDNNMPDIAVSTGGADTLECLMRRIGLPESEYVAGTGTTGHVHVFSGGKTSTGTHGGGGGNVGKPEQTIMPGAPTSSTDLWANQTQLMPYDILLLSCEGGETYNAVPASLEAYLNAGGRAFGSHFHYSWFSGPLGSQQSYTAPTDWGSNLATWTTDQQGGSDPMGGIIDQTLNGSTAPFSKGVTLAKWLGVVGALGQAPPPDPASDLAIAAPRYNATVGPTNKPSQPWITSDKDGIAGQTMYFSFDTPVNAPVPAGGSAPNYCGRAVFSDLHVSGATNDDTGKPPPSSCQDVDLSPQEKALEFMLFDLSSCVIPDTVTVPTDAGLPYPPPK
jgi:hypothetical protein